LPGMTDNSGISNHPRTSDGVEGTQFDDLREVAKWKEKPSNVGIIYNFRPCFCLDRIGKIKSKIYRNNYYTI
jgi:hypothetical protein